MVVGWPIGGQGTVGSIARSTGSTAAAPNPTFEKNDCEADLPFLPLDYWAAGSGGVGGGGWGGGEWQRQWLAPLHASKAAKQQAAPGCRPAGNQLQQAGPDNRQITALPIALHRPPTLKATHQAECRLLRSSSPLVLMEWNSTAAPFSGLAARCLRAHSLKVGPLSPPGAGMLGNTV